MSSALVTNKATDNLVELHPLDHFQRSLDRFCFLDRDRAVLAPLSMASANDLADRLVQLAETVANLRDLGALAYFLGIFLSSSTIASTAFMMPPLQRRRVRAGVTCGDLA